MATGDEPRQQPLHILFLPFFAPGHLLPVADMAVLFSAQGARCTIPTTPVNADIIRPAVDRGNDSNCHNTAVDISVVPFPDVGLPPGVENLMAFTTLNRDQIGKFMQSVHLLREPFTRFLAHNLPDAVVSDSFFSWSVDAAAEHGIPRLVFIGSSVFARCCNDAMLRNCWLYPHVEYFPTTATINGDDDLLSNQAVDSGNTCTYRSTTKQLDGSIFN